MLLNNKYYISEYYSEMYLKDPRDQMSAFVKKLGNVTLKKAWRICGSHSLVSGDLNLLDYDLRSSVEAFPRCQRMTVLLKRR
jgi:hypothetical protein